jgi:hypothetical protein
LAEYQNHYEEFRDFLNTRKSKFYEPMIQCDFDQAKKFQNMLKAFEQGYFKEYVEAAEK